jgi:hypothetical protein
MRKSLDFHERYDVLIETSEMLWGKVMGKTAVQYGRKEIHLATITMH